MGYLCGEKSPVNSKTRIPAIIGREFAITMDDNNINPFLRQGETGMIRLLLMLFHHAGCGRINTLMTSPNGDPETDTAANSYKGAGDDTYPNNMMYESRIIYDKIRYCFIHR